MAFSTQEAWRPVSEAPDFEVSDMGRVRRVTAAKGTTAGKVAKPTINHAGYPVVGLSRDGAYFVRLVHRLVAIAFLGDPPSPKHQAAHTNGDRADPRLSNLRWASAKENAADRLLHGTDHRGEKHPGATISNATADAIRNAPRPPVHAYLAAIAKDFGVSRKVVQQIRAGKTWGRA